MVFIYHLEDHPDYAPLTQTIFDAWESGRTCGVTSVITLLEILIQPKRAGQRQIAADYRDVLTRFPNLLLQEITIDIVEIASDLRATYQLRTPDALQLATGLATDATGFITNDAALRRVSEIDVLLLDETLAD